MNKVELTEDVARDVARRVLNYFGFGDLVIDNILDQDDRRLFYFLQDSGILSTEWDEVFLLNGRNWRIFYWRLNVHSIRRWTEAEDEETEEELGIYDMLPESAWCREEAT